MKPLSNNRVPVDPLEAAEYWSARRRLQSLGAREEAQFQDWLAVPEHARAWARVDGLVQDIGRFAAMPDIMALRHAALAAAPRESDIDRARVARWRNRGLAGLAVAISAMIAMFAILPAIRALAPQQEAAATAHRLATKVGEKRVLKLPDGSFVTLDTNSLVEVRYSQGLRDVRLLAGQAFFKVAKNPLRPFVVTAADRRITAVGTAFDVRLGDKGAMSVMLVEGRVVVEPTRHREGAMGADIAGREELAPGERLVVPAKGAARIVAADVERGTSWQRGKLIFRDEPMTDAIAELNRYTQVKLVSGDPRVQSLRVSGVFNAGGNENFVAAITQFYPVRATRRSPGVIELEWRTSDS